MMTLTRFLLARITEDETIARATLYRHPFNGSEQRWWTATERGDRAPDDWWAGVGQLISSGDWVHAGTVREVDAEHIARHDPARVLAEAWAKRQVVELHSLAGDAFDADGIERPGRECVTCWDDHPCATLRALAGVYAGHPDYDGTWKP